MPTKSLKLSFRRFCILAVGPSFKAQRDPHTVRVKGQMRRVRAVGVLHIETLKVDLGHRHTVCPTNS